MEKPRMGTRRQYRRTGLLTTALLLMPVLCFAETGPQILIRSSPDRPVAGSLWSLTLMVAHHEPNEVNILVPHFTDSLILDQVNKVSRLINPVSGQVQSYRSDEPIPPAFEWWTLMEYRFMLSSPGTINFEAFTVITPQGRTETAPFEIMVLKPQNTAAIRNYRLVWVELPENLKNGESAIFGLRISGWSSGNPLPAEALPSEALFLPSVPPGYILESVPLGPHEKLEGIAFKMRLIPLKTGLFTLERRQITYNDSVFEIPALRIPISAAVDSQAENKSASNETVPQNKSPIVQLPLFETATRIHSSLYQKYHDECETIYAAVKILWESGNRAGALATLRQKERDHPAGVVFASLRRGAESAIGITGANDEKKQLLPFLKKKNQTAVLRETAIRQIPDSAGMEIVRLKEGQPVLLNGTARTAHETWLMIITNDDNKTFGWVPEENIIVY